MKNQLINVALFLFGCLTLNANAQAQTFAPAGAEWHYNSRYGIYHSHVTGDTLILGKRASIIKQDAIESWFWSQQGFSFYGQPTVYMYGNSDSVFIYNETFHKFTPLYVFNVQAGDTVGLPVVPISGARVIDFGVDSNFYFVVDSVKMELYDTAHLKTVYSHTVRYQNSPELHWGLFGVNSVYVEKIGGYYGLTPVCGHGCGHIPEAMYPDSIRCYQEPGLSIKLVAGACNDIASAIGAVPLSGTEFSVSPNPAKGKLRIKNRTNHAITAIKLYAIDGKLARAFTVTQSNELSIETIPAGLYFLQVIFQNHPPFQQRIVIQH